MPAIAATITPLLSVLRSEDGIWKRVVEPLEETEKSVEVAMPFVVGPCKVKSGMLDALEVAATVRRATGELVPSAKLPVLVKRPRSSWLVVNAI